jgi:hypothetical protein
MDRVLVSRTLLQLRNNLDRESKLSPARLSMGESSQSLCQVFALIGDMWMNLVDARETAQTCRAKHSEKQWSEHMKRLHYRVYKVGDTLMVQNQSGNHPFR